MIRLEPDLVDTIIKWGKLPSLGPEALPNRQITPRRTLRHATEA